MLQGKELGPQISVELAVRGLGFRVISGEPNFTFDQRLQDFQNEGVNARNTVARTLVSSTV
jgi:hypothetical protein